MIVKPHLKYLSNTKIVKVGIMTQRMKLDTV